MYVQQYFASGVSVAYDTSFCIANLAVAAVPLCEEAKRLQPASGSAIPRIRSVAKLHPPPKRKNRELPVMVSKESSGAVLMKLTAM